MKKYWKRKIPFVIAMAVAGMAAFIGAVMLLWNGILPSVLHVSAITFWQAAGILLLAKILFGGRRGWRRHGYRMAGRCRDKNTLVMCHNRRSGMEPGVNSAE